MSSPAAASTTTRSTTDGTSSVPMLTIPHLEKSVAFQETAEEAMRLVQQFASRNPYDEHDGDNNPWNNPDDMLRQLNDVRNRVQAAWQTLETALAQDNVNRDKELDDKDELQLRAAYMDMVTDAFADVLHNLQQNDENLDVDVLVDCLQSGLEFMSHDDKVIWLQLLKEDSDIEEYYSSDDDGMQHDNALTPHEIRRRALGFHHVPTTDGGSD